MQAKDLPTTRPATPISLRDPQWGFAWSNQNIADDVLIRKALAAGRFTAILQACLEFGMDRVQLQWPIVAQDPELTTPAIRNLVNDILRNIAKGLSHAET